MAWLIYATAGWTGASAQQPVPATAPATRNAPAPDDVLRRQYEAAQDAQAAGDMARAEAGYRAFLAGTLRRVAERRAQSGDYPAAAKLFAEALGSGAPDTGGELRLAYAEAALVYRDLPLAKTLARGVLEVNPKSSAAHLVLGEALLQTEENEAAHRELELAVALDSNYKTGLALATADLALGDTAGAATIFAEMAAAFHDTASLHLDFGKAYAEAGDPDLAIPEFIKAIAKEPELPQAHYCLGASYLLRDGEEGFAKAIPKFERELKLHPDNYFSMSQLGYIALQQHRVAEAAAFLQAAAQLDARNPDNFLLLGQVYTQLNRPADAEAAYRTAIALTTDPSRNHFQVERAHYLLGRLLVQSGRAEEGKRQMQVAGDLLKQNMARDQARMKGAAMGGSQAEAASISPLTHPADPLPVSPPLKTEADAFSARVAPAIADAYNNLGAIAASQSNYASATLEFERAGRWNPGLESLDYNWGRAAFTAEFYGQAVGPLGRYVAAHPGEDGARRVLGISLFRTGDFAGVVATLKPLEESLPGTPQLEYMYAASLVRAGSYQPGLSRLERLAAADPSIAEVHRSLGEAYAAHGEFASAAREFRAALQWNAEDAEARDQLAVALVHLHRPNAADATGGGTRP